MRNSSVTGRILLAVFFVLAGVLHFAFPTPYLKIIPPVLPHPTILLWISGAAEICGGLGLFLSKARRLAAYGLALLLVAVFPANIYMAVAHVPFPGLLGQPWLQWSRLAVQPLLIWWTLRYAKPNPTASK